MEVRLDKTIDSIRCKFGAETIMRGAMVESDAGVGKKYKARLDNAKDSNIDKNNSCL